VDYVELRIYRISRKGVSVITQ